MKHCAVIMAGGVGTRLWPLSRRGRPKQLLRIIEGRSLIYGTFERLNLAFSPSQIHVVALAEHLPAIAAELPAMPPDNFIGEPVGRDTANAVALAAAILHEQDPETIMGVFTADHVIRPADKFVEVIRRGFAVAAENPDALVTFGITPTEPHTGLGYIERGEAASPGVWGVRMFKEKPDLDTARRYVASGRYYWNSGMFVWRTRTILDQLRQHLPESYAAACQMAKVWNTPAGRGLVRELYPGLRKISIDFAVMEKAANVLMVEMPTEWLDVGHWTALPSVMGGDSFGNTLAAARVITRSAENNIFVAEDEHLIAAIGIRDLVVVHSPDATLICRRDQVERIRDLVADLEQEYGGHYT